jgi:hypothetical protein
LILALRFDGWPDEAVELGHESRLVARGVVFVNDPFGRGAIEGAHRVADRQRCRFRIAVSDEAFRSADKRPCRGSKYSVTLPLSL